MHSPLLYGTPENIIIAFTMHPYLVKRFNETQKSITSPLNPEQNKLYHSSRNRDRMDKPPKRFSDEQCNQMSSKWIYIIFAGINIELLSLGFRGGCVEGMRTKIFCSFLPKFMTNKLNVDISSNEFRRRLPCSFLKFQFHWFFSRLS